MTKHHANTVNRGLNQLQRGQQECHKFAHLTMKNNSFSQFAHEFCTLRRHSYPVHDMK